MSIEENVTTALSGQILREAAEAVCKLIYYAKIYFREGPGGMILFDDTVGRVNTGDPKVKVVYIPAQHRRRRGIYAEIHYFDVDKRPLMWTGLGNVGNGDILSFTVPRPEDFHYVK